MINPQDLPRDPIEALRAILAVMIAKTSGGATIKKLKATGHPLYTKLLIASLSAAKAASHIPDQSIRSQVIKLLALQEELTTDEYRNNIEDCLKLCIAMQFDDHFIDSEEAALFDEAELTDDEKNEIRNLMATARKLTQEADYLQNWQKRNIQFLIAKIENELVRDKTRYQAFLAAAAQMSGLVRTVGEDAQPLANAISEAKTITQRKVEGYKQIAAEEKPKQIEDKTDKTEPADK